MIQLWLIRHGQTEWNLQKRYQGRGDSPLTEQGIQNAQLARPEVLALRPDVVYSSPSRRAWRTAELLFSPMPVNPCELLLEIALGQMEGMTGEEARAAFPQVAGLLWDCPQDFVPPGQGETVAQLMQRAAAFLQKVQQGHAGQRVCAVSHGATIRALLAVVEGRGPETLWQGGVPENLHPLPLVFDQGVWRRSAQEQGSGLLSY